MISPEKQTIEQILGGTKINFSVPNYQRSFDWGKGELQELIDDLKESKKKNYFLVILFLTYQIQATIKLLMANKGLRQFL